MTGVPADGGAPAEIMTSRQTRDPLKVLDSLAIELGRLAAERDFAKERKGDKTDPDGLSSTTGESVQ